MEPDTTTGAESRPEPIPVPEPLRDRLLDQWEPRGSAYLAYRKEIETMLETQEKALLREKRMTTYLWFYVVALTTIFLTGAGLFLSHKIEGTFLAITGVFWFLFGAVFLFRHLINASRFEVIKEIKGVELRLAALEDRLAGKGEPRG